jgi:hypothetical protein
MNINNGLWRKVLPGMWLEFALRDLQRLKAI